MTEKQREAEQASLVAEIREKGAAEALEKWRKNNRQGTRINLRGANLRALDFRGMHLVGANLQGANLECCRFEKAHLTWSNLRNTKLHGANLRDADMFGAHLQGADLTGADLTNALLEDAVGLGKLVGLPRIIDPENRELILAHARYAMRTQP